MTEHIEGDECKFSVWTGREPMASDCRIVLKAPSLDVKQTWVRRLREVIQVLSILYCSDDSRLFIQIILFVYFCTWVTKLRKVTV